MIKSLSNLVLAGLFLAILPFAACDIDGERPDTPENLSVTEAGGSLTLTWDPVAGATGYTVYYTDDSSAPSTASPKSDVAAASFTLETESAATLYRFAVATQANDRASRLSAATDAARSLPQLFVTVTYSGYADGNAGLLVVRLEPDDSGDDDGFVVVSGSARYAVGKTDADGTIVFDPVALSRDSVWAYSVFKDTNANGTLDAGDLIWSINGNLAYFRVGKLPDRTEPPDEDTVRSFPDWDNAHEDITIITLD